ncbi:alpha/beta hydrolase [Caldithrix abyssi]
MSKRSGITVFIVALLFLSSGFAGTLDTLYINSSAMHKTIPAVIVLPDAYSDSDQNFSVIYLLHGYSGSYKDWPAHVDLPPLADRYGFILVCPDGGYDSWYLDSPVDPASQYETHISKEVIPYIDAHYRTIKARGGRAITGLSMGGHGALYLAMRHASLFYAASSMSGGVDLTFWLERWGKPVPLA